MFSRGIGVNNPRFLHLLDSSELLMVVAARDLIFVGNDDPRILAF